MVAHARFAEYPFELDYGVKFYSAQPTILTHPPHTSREEKKRTAARKKMETLWGYFESFFGGLGLNTQFKRFLAVAAGGGLLEFALKPGYAFESDGKMRSWAGIPLFSSEAEPGATYTPIGFWPSLAGLIAAMFI